MSSPIRSFLNLLAVAAIAGVFFWRENVWRSRSRAASPPAASASVSVSSTTGAELSGSTAGNPGAGGAQDVESLSADGVLQKKLVAAESRMEALTAEVERLKAALEASKPPPSPAELASRFAQQRGLAFDPPPVWKPVPLDEILAGIQKEVEAGLPQASAEVRSRAAVAMGFHPDLFEYLPAVISLAQMTSGGLYQSADNVFLYREEASLARADGRETFIGALAFALASQKAGTTPALYDPANDDEALALRSLVSGDANASRIRFSIADQMNLNFDRSGAPAVPPPNYSAPVYLAETWKFSQDKGSLFVDALAQKGGNAAVDAAYVRRPRSSAEILHPEELYLADPPFQPVSVPLPADPVAGQTAYFTNTAGELGTYIALRSWLGVEEATAASEGWAGDRYSVWAGTEGVGDHFFWKTVWRNSAEAQEFFKHLRVVAMQRFSIPWRSVYDAESNQFRVEDPARYLHLRLDPARNTVTFLHATDPEFGKNLVTASATW